MTEDDFRSYIAAFNGNDFDGFGHFYSDDVVFELGDNRRAPLPATGPVNGSC